MSKSSIFEAADWAIGKYLRLRPSWLNRITWLIVFAGVLICSQPIWLSVLSAVLRQRGGIEVPEGPSPWIGVLLISIGLFFNYVKQKNERGELTFSERDKRDHDAQLLSSLRAVASFKEIREVLAWIEDSHAIFKEDREVLRNYASFLSSTENELLDSEANSKAQEYEKAITELMSFLTYNFFVYPNTEFDGRGFQYCLYPDLNPDRGGDVNPKSLQLYERYADELLALVENVRASQVQFIKSAKAALGSQFQQ